MNLLVVYKICKEYVVKFNLKHLCAMNIVLIGGTTFKSWPNTLSELEKSTIQQWMHLNNDALLSTTTPLKEHLSPRCNLNVKPFSSLMVINWRHMTVDEWSNSFRIIYLISLYFTVTAPTANATTSVAEVTVMETPACLRAMPSLVSRLHLE